MRNLLPLAALGCVTVIILGVIAGGIVMIGYGARDVFEKESPQAKQKDTPPKSQPGPGPILVPNPTLLEARKDFTTKLIQSNFQRSSKEPAFVPEARVVYYKSSAINLAAYLSNRPKEGPKRPAVVWVHDGFGGISGADWNQAKPFYDAGFIVMVPSFREENVNNGGGFEMFYGEVDDLLAAIDFAAKQDGVDPNRIYVVGYGTGGTLTLLAAVSGHPTARAYFAIGGTPNLEESLRVLNAVENVTPPFNPNAGKKEAYFRSAFPFVASIRQPTFYFGASAIDPPGCNQAMQMEAAASQRQVPFRAFLNPRVARRETFAPPLVDLIRQKIERDTGQVPAIRFELAEVLQPSNK